MASVLGEPGSPECHLLHCWSGDSLNRMNHCGGPRVLCWLQGPGSCMRPCPRCPSPSLCWPVPAWPRACHRHRGQAGAALVGMVRPASWLGAERSKDPTRGPGLSQLCQWPRPDRGALLPRPRGLSPTADRRWGLVGLCQCWVWPHLRPQGPGLAPGGSPRVPAGPGRGTVLPASHPRHPRHASRGACGVWPGC